METTFLNCLKKPFYNIDKSIVEVYFCFNKSLTSLLSIRSCILSCVQPFYEWAVSDLDRYR
jgi:hypothetical protein